jgi:hypothetical protein
MVLVPQGAQADVLFGADGEHGNATTNLYLLDPTTGAKVATIGPIGFAVSDLAYDPANGGLYADTAPRGTGSRQLISINPNTGAGTLIGPLGAAMDGIAFDQNGVLYGWSGRISGSSLYTINTATGAATRVATSGLTDSGAALAFDPLGTLYLANAGASGVLRTVNKTTGVATNGPTLSGAPIPTGAIKALAFNSAGTLFADNLAEGGPGSPGAPGNTFLVTINPTSGAVTTVGPSIAGLDSLAFIPEAPEPSSMVLATMGALVALAGTRMRRALVQRRQTIA